MPKIVSDQKTVKQNIAHVLRLMDFLNDRYLAKGRARTRKDFQRFFDIYQMLGTAWEYFSLQCRHGKGFRRVRDGHQACWICGKIRGAPQTEVLLNVKGPKVIGRFVPSPPRSVKTRSSEKAAMVVDDAIRFHGATLKVRVHHSYPSRLFKGKDSIAIAKDRIVELKERGVGISIDDHLVNVEWPGGKRQRGKIYGGLAFELPKKLLAKFPILFSYGPRGQFYGLELFRPSANQSRRRTS